MVRSLRRWRFPALALCLAVAAGCAGRTRKPSLPARGRVEVVAIMGAARLSAPQLAAWFTRRPGALEAYRASVPLETLAQIYVEEGAAEGVAGDVAFVQAVVETGWFRFQGLVGPRHNNFAGLGATDERPAPDTFPDARTGVRAQIQHLRAYADASAVACESPPLGHPCADPRFHLVTPKGRARSWNAMGGGNWAASPAYSRAILRLYREALEHAAGH